MRERSRIFIDADPYKHQGKKMEAKKIHLRRKSETRAEWGMLLGTTIDQQVERLRREGVEDPEVRVCVTGEREIVIKPTGIS